MKQVMKTLYVSLMAAALMAPVALMAQSEEKEKERKKEDVEQIIIMHKGEKKGKIVVEVEGEKITVNGKEYKKGDKDSDIIVERSRYKDDAFGSGHSMNFWSGEPGGRYRALTGYLSNDRAMLGVTTEKVEGGVEVKEVTKESAAEKIGLKKGDIIKKIGDAKIETPDELSKAIQEKEPGDKVTVTYLRDKKESTSTAELTKWKGVNVFTTAPGMEGFRMDLGLDDMNFDAFPRAHSVPAIPRVRGHNGNYSYSWSGGAPRLGLSIQDTEDGKGVKVLEVDEDGNGAKAGIKEEDIITEVDGKAVNSADEIAKLMRESKEKISVKMKLQRNGKTETVEVKIPRRLKTADL